MDKRFQIYGGYGDMKLELININLSILGFSFEKLKFVSPRDSCDPLRSKKISRILKYGL